MKFAKLKAFLSGKKVVDTVAEKGDGTVTFSAAQAEAVESLASELETAQSALATANSDLETARYNAATMQTSIDMHEANANAVRTALDLPESATNEEVVTAISGLRTEIQTLGKQPGSLGKSISKNKDKGEEGGAGETLTSFDEEARAIYAELHPTKN